MAKVPYTNNTDKVQHVGPVTLFPSDTREVEETDLPNYKPEPKPETEQVNPLLDLLDQSIPKFADAIAEVNSDGSFVVSDNDLSVLEQAENAPENSKPRAGIGEAISVERLRRADEAQEIEEFVKELSEMSDDDLTASVDLYQDDAGRVALVQGEIDRRAAGAIAE